MSWRTSKDLAGKMVVCGKCRFKFTAPLPTDKSTTGTPHTKQNEMNPKQDSFLLVGNLAVKLGYITTDQLKKALELQREKKEQGMDSMLGEIFIEKGFMTQDQLDFVLSLQEMRQIRSLDRKFGEKVIDQGLASKEIIEEGLNTQKEIFFQEKRITLLGDILVEQGIITGAQRDDLLRRQNRIRDEGEDKGEAPYDLGREAEAPPEGLQITVSEDKMTAFLKVTTPEASSVSVDKVKQLLASEGICHGVIPDQDIARYIEQTPRPTDPLEIAVGTKPTQGQDGQIKYYFNTDPLKIGTVRKGGVIDFRDRGRLPQVKKGTLLARRVPGLPGEPGRDVFGKEVPPPKPKEAKIKSGKGVEKSEDGNKAHAGRDGAPMLSADGKIYVLSRLEIPGDVGLETGHVDFDGDIDIKGAVQDGFWVRGGRLSASEILRADVSASGDVVVAGGIIGATVRSDGSLKARYIHDARIHVLGDVVVEKEVIDSDIMTNGAFMIQEGKVFNSRISAKKGIQAFQIGSAKSKPCRLVVGIDEEAAARIKNLKRMKESKEKRQKKWQAAIKKLKAVSNNILKEVTELAYIADRGPLEQKRLQKEMESAKSAGDENRTAILKDKIAELGKRINTAEARTNVLMDQQGKVDAKISDLEQQIERLESEKLALAQDIEEIYEWSQSTGGTAEVKVKETIFSHTIVKGPRCSIKLKENLDRLIIAEKQVQEPETQKTIWKMVISSLK